MKYSIMVLLNALSKHVWGGIILMAVACAPSVFSQSTCIVINEFVVDPKDGANGDPDETGEFIELYNTCNCTVDISCFVLCITDNSGGRRGDCITIPSGTSLAAGGVYLLGGYGTNCTGGASACDWSGLSLDLNWHSSAATVWGVAGNAFYTTNVGNYIGVVADGGEDLSLFDGAGTFIYGVFNDGGAGVNSNNTENIGAVSGCVAKSVTIPPTSLHTDAGNTPGSAGADGGFRRNCDNTWTHVQKSGQTPGTPLACTLTSCILPVELLSFDGDAHGEINFLRWHTASETNNNYFVVEKSPDGFLFWAADTVAGSGTTQMIRSYAYADSTPYSAITYYRLKQTDYNGDFAYSKIIAVSSSAELDGFSDLRPNPCVDNFQFSINRDKISAGEFRLSVFNNLGQLVAARSYDTESNDNFVFDTARLPPGIYTVVISAETTAITRKIFVSRD